MKTVSILMFLCFLCVSCAELEAQKEKLNSLLDPTKSKSETVKPVSSDAGNLQESALSQETLSPSTTKSPSNTEKQTPVKNNIEQSKVTSDPTKTNANRASSNSDRVSVQDISGQVKRNVKEAAQNAGVNEKKPAKVNIADANVDKKPNKTAQQYMGFDANQIDQNDQKACNESRKYKEIIQLEYEKQKNDGASPEELAKLKKRIADRSAEVDKLIKRICKG